MSQVQSFAPIAAKSMAAASALKLQELGFDPIPGTPFTSALIRRDINLVHGKKVRVGGKKHKDGDFRFTSVNIALYQRGLYGGVWRFEEHGLDLVVRSGDLTIFDSRETHKVFVRHDWGEVDPML